MHLRRKYVLLIALLSVGSIAIAQDGSSLGDIARRLRNEKNNSSASTTTPAPSVAPSSKTSTADVNKTAGSPAATAVKVMDDEGLTFEQHIRELMLAEKFAELDQIADSMRTSKTRLRGGPWAIHVLYSQLAGLPEHSGTEMAWEQNIARLKRWIKERPESITARLTLAITYDQFGWFARGSGYADTVTDQGQQLFDERMQSAMRALTDPFFAKQKDPEWFLELQDIARAQGAEISEQQVIFNKAVAFEPDYQYYYRKQAEMLLPKWYGNGTDAAEFTTLAADRIGGRKGDFIYYQVAASIYCHCDSNTDYDAMDWARIKRGFHVEEEEFGLSNFELNRMAMMAAYRLDPKLANDLLTRIQVWEPEIWSSEKGFEEMKAWARNALRQDSTK